jgi:hypothetical protein
MTQAFTKKPAANGVQPENSATKTKHRRAMSPETKAKLIAGTKAFWAKKNAAKAAVSGKDEPKSVAAQPNAAPQGEVTGSAVTNQPPTMTTNAAENVEGQNESTATLGKCSPPTEAGVAVIHATDGSEPPASLQDSADQVASTAMVQFVLADSGQIAEIPASVSPITSFRQEAVEDMTDERLDLYICGHFVGFKKNLRALAEGLDEKKKRLARKGCEGKWSGFVKHTVGMSLSWADRLVRNWNRYLQLGARVRGAAEQAGVNINKPAVIALLQSYNDEFLSTVEPSEKRFAACVLALQEAGKRQQNSDQPADDPETDAGESGSEDADDYEQEEGVEHEKAKNSSPKDKTISLHFSALQAEEFDELIADLKTRMATQDRPNIVLHAIRNLVRSFKEGGVANHS